MQVSLTACALVLALLPVQARPQDPSGAAAPPPRLLEVDVIAVDRRGEPVSDLRPEEIEIWLEGYRIPLESLTALSDSDARRRRSLVLVLDDITLRPDLTARARDVAQKFVQRLEPGDRMAIVTLTGRATKSTDDRAVLRRFVETYGVRATLPLRPEDLAGRVLNTLTAVSRQVEELPGHRRTVVGIGPAWVFDTPIPPAAAGRDLREEWTTALRAMALANVAFYVVDPAGVGSTPALGGAGGIARDTGGHAFVNTNDLAGAVDRIVREAVTYYIARFEDPPFFRKAPLRKLDVRARRPNVTVRARTLIPGAPPARAAER